jgi:hypothetical protein
MKNGHFENLAECLASCREIGFNPEITAEVCWNEGYAIGRDRWHWGPRWAVTVRGWFNTQLSRLYGKKKTTRV